MSAKEANTHETNLNAELDGLSETIELLIAGNIERPQPISFGEQGFVIAVDGKWGTGKTFFLNHFAEKIKNKDKDGHHEVGLCSFKKNSDKTGYAKQKVGNPKSKYPVILIRYNAWENDFMTDPFVSLVGQICKQATINSFKCDTVLKTAVSIGKNLLKAGDQKYLADYLKGIIKDQTKKNIETEQVYKELNSDHEEFKKALSNLGASKEQANENKTNPEPAKGPIKLILVDELDRCTPVFAVKLLERIKHLFDVRNTVFLIALDASALKHTIKKVYGNTFDGEGYLSRFFNVELMLPVGSAFIDGLWNKLGFVEKGRGGLPKSKLEIDSDLLRFSKKVCAIFNFMPREIIKYVTLLNRTEKIVLFKHFGKLFYLLLAIKMHSHKKFTSLIEYASQNRDIAWTEDSLKHNHDEFITKIKNDFSEYPQFFDDDYRNEILYEFYSLHCLIIIENRIDHETKPIDGANTVALKQFVDKYLPQEKHYYMQYRDKFTLGDFFNGIKYFK